jgi:7-cyano-7-deazaguanine synthase in queuosine biosynthesis
MVALARSLIKTPLRNLLMLLSAVIYATHTMVRNIWLRFMDKRPHEITAIYPEGSAMSTTAITFQ